MMPRTWLSRRHDRAGSAAQLQAGVSAVRAWCDKWRMQANVGPGKSAVVLFAPEAAAQPLVDGDLEWGGAPLPPCFHLVSTWGWCWLPIAAGMITWIIWWTKPPGERLP